METIFRVVFIGGLLFGGAYVVALVSGQEYQSLLRVMLLLAVLLGLIIASFTWCTRKRPEK
jgi:hypothetical protein